MRRTLIFKKKKFVYLNKSFKIFQMTSSDSALKTYLISKIEELEHKIQEKNQNVKRLQAQRNELNSSGIIFLHLFI